MENNPTHKAKTLDGTWIEGWYDGSIESNPIIWCKHRRGCYHFEINPTTLCRSTYRPDSNGKIMYEGDEIDVAREMFDVIEASGVYTIEWDNVCCGFVLIAEGKEALEFNEMDYYYSTGKNKHD